MYNETLYEKNRIRDRFKEIFTLAVFTIAIALISLVAMNLLIYPIVLFAVTYKNAYTVIIKYLFTGGIIALFASLVLVTIYRLHNDGLAARAIALYIFKKPFYYLSIFLFFIALSAVIIGVIYFVFTNNYYLLYKITQ